MKAMVLAAGLGIRMRPLTLLRAKPVLPVLNRPLIYWTLERLAALGVRQVMLNLHHLPATVRRAVGGGRAFGLEVQYSWERRILGTGGGPRRVREFFGREPFLLVNGDVLFDFDLSQVLERHRARRARATLVLKRHRKAAAYGAVVTGPGGWIRSLAGLPRPAPGPRSIFTGIHVLEPELLERLPPGVSDTVRDLYAPMIAEGGRVLGMRVRGAWYDFGSPSLYLASHLSLMARGFRGRGRARRLIHPQARVHRAARVDRSVVGPRSAVGQGASVSGSVLWDGVRVGPGSRVNRCVLASGTQVEPGERLEKVVVVPAARLQAAPPGARLRGGRYLVQMK